MQILYNAQCTYNIHRVPICTELYSVQLTESWRMDGEMCLYNYVKYEALQAEGPIHHPGLCVGTLLEKNCHNKLFLPIFLSMNY